MEFDLYYINPVPHTQLNSRAINSWNVRMFNKSDTLSEAFCDLVWTLYANLLVNVSVCLRLKSKDGALK
jgi:hypothetical protein